MDVGSTLLEFRPELRTQAWAEITRKAPGDIEEAWRSARSRARALSGYETAEEYEAFRLEVCSLALDALAFEGDRQTCVAAMSEAWIRTGWMPFEDVRPALSALREDGYRLGVVSNWTATLEFTLAHVGLTQYFEVVSCSAVVGATKPDARIFRHALSALAVDAARALYVGDHYDADVVGARGAGMDAVLVARDASVDAAADERKIRTLSELLTFVNAQCAGS